MLGSSRRLKIAASAFMLPLLAVIAFLAATPVSAARPATSVPCNTPSLISAISTAVIAGGSQTISLTPGCTYTLTAVNNGADTNTNGLPLITNTVSLTINGSGATILRDPGAPRFRFFQLVYATTLTLNQLTLTGGFAPDGVLATDGRGGDGGAISIDTATLIVTNSRLSGNQAGNGGSCCSGSNKGFGGSGGAIFSYFGMVSVINSTLAANSSGAAGSQGGGFGGYGGAVYANGGLVSLTNSTVSENRTGDGNPGGGFFNSAGFGGGLYAIAGTLHVLNSTLSGNTTGNGGGITGYGGAIATDTATFTMTNSTVASNTVGTSGSIGGIALFNGSSLLAKNTLLSLNDGGNCAGFSVANIHPNSTHNMSDSNCGTFFTQKTAVEINLGPLQANGGATLTMALRAPSAAVNAGDNLSCPGTDQRGLPRPSGSQCDIGAFELQLARLFLPLVRR